MLRPLFRVSRRDRSKRGTNAIDHQPFQAKRFLAVRLDRGLKGANSLLAGYGAAALLVGFARGGKAEGAIMLAPAVLALVLRLASWLGARAARRHDVSRGRLDLGHTVLALSAAMLGLAWSASTLASSLGAEADVRLVVEVCSTALVAGAFRLGPTAEVRVLFVAPVCLGMIAVLALAPTTAAIALLFVAAVAFAGWTCREGARSDAAADRHLVDALRVADQQETIDALLLDFEQNEGDRVWQSDATGRLIHASESGREAGDALAALFDDRDAKELTVGARAVRLALAGHKPFRNQIAEVKRDGGARWYRLSGKPVFDGAGLFLGFRGVASDVTDARDAESRIAYLANYDSLTGVANRANFHALMARECAAAANDGNCRALVCLDLDGFKGVNDDLGHEGGDEILKEVSSRLVGASAPGACVGRLGGDEFAVWLSPTTPRKAEAAAAAMIAALSRPFDLDGVQVEIGASAGIAFTPQHTTEAEALLVKADLALYRAKGEGRGRACVFENRFETSFVERRNLESDLKLAIARGEFELHYQPLVDIAGARVTCFEALIRWHSPTRGLVSPADFVPAAENAALIGPIGRWALFEACRTAATWPDDVHVAVNVSPPQVRAPDFVRDVVMALRSSGLSPSRLEIEVTEGVFLDRSPAAIETLSQLRDRGIQIALDDFGTGYSSLRYLVDFPVDKIKIDRAFVADLLDSEANQAIVDAIIGIARKLGLRVTAEGVETKAQAQALMLKRCDDLQGYLLSRPRPARDVPEMIATAPLLLQKAVPAHMNSPLALALVGRHLAAG